jgi:hypothetical protein
VIDHAGALLKAGDDAVLLCEVQRVIEAGGNEDPGVVVKVLNSDMQLFISARKVPLRGLVVSEELMKLQTEEVKKLEEATT